MGDFCMKNINKSFKNLSIRLRGHGDVGRLKCCGTSGPATGTSLCKPADNTDWLIGSVQ